MLSRDAPAADPAAVFTENERHLLDQATPDRKRQAPRDLQFYVRAVARLGGYLDRASDAPSGTTVIWRGFSRLADLVEGARLATPPPTLVGNCKPRRRNTMLNAKTPVCWLGPELGPHRSIVYGN